jgi:signal transduction histidine kinase
MKRRACLFILTALILKGAAGQVSTEGLSLWLMADKGVQLNNDKLTLWKDQSGNNHHASALLVNSPLLAPNQLNGLPSIRFNGMDNSIETVPFQTFPQKRGTISIVLKINGDGKTSGGGYNTLVSTYFNQGVTWQFGVMKELAIYYDGVGTDGFPVAEVPERKWSIITILRNSDTTMNFYRDGDFKLSFRIKNNQPGINPLKIASNGRLEVLNGEIAEILVYGKVLNDVELKKMHRYLEKKYQIKLKAAAEEKNNRWLYLLLLIPVLFAAVSITKYVSQKKIKKELLKQQEMDRERQRISREMHDDIGAGLTQITMMSEWAKLKTGSDNVKELEDIAETSRRLVNSMSEIIWSLNPDNNTLGQLIAYLRELLNRLQEYSGKVFNIQLPENGSNIMLSNEQRRNILLVTKEIVNNVIKHSDANHISVTMKFQQGFLDCEIHDDGKGFDTTKEYTGNGLKNIQHRISAMGGKLHFTSVPGNGSRFYFSIKI